jgi:hypothetical protein
MLDRLNMTTCKKIFFLEIQRTKIFVEGCPKSYMEMEDMKKVPYVSIVDSIYVCYCLHETRNFPRTKIP